MKKNPFTLIELLVVIAIIGLLAALILPKFNNMEEKTKDTISNYNAGEIEKFVYAYRAANDALPSNLHTGLKTLKTASTMPSEAVTDVETVDNFPPVVTAQINDGRAKWAGFNHKCLYNAGIVSLAAGNDGDLSQDLLDPTLIMGMQANLPVGLYVDDSWTKSCKVSKGVFSTSGDPITFHGLTLGQLREQYDDAAGDDMTKKIMIMAFFFGPTTNTQMIFRPDGKFWKNSEIKTNYKLAPNARYFNYPVLFFLLSGNPAGATKAEFLGACGISDDGTQLIN